MKSEPLPQHSTESAAPEEAARSRRLTRWAAASGGIVAIAVGAACWFSSSGLRTQTARGFQPAIGLVPASSTVTSAPTDDLDVFESTAYPEICRASAIEVSLGLLAQNGADLNRPMPCRHRVLAANRQVAEKVGQWARTHDFFPTTPELYHEHGGVERFQIDLVRTVIPSPEIIEGQAVVVHSGMKSIPGTAYQSWMGDIVR